MAKTTENAPGYDGRDGSIEDTDDPTGDERIAEEATIMREGNRVILVHLYVEASPTDTRTADEIGEFIHGSVELGSEGREDVPALLSYDVTLCDEIEGPGPAQKEGG